MITYKYEYTDTFCGEANYSWVKRGKVTANSFAHAWRKIKAELGLQGWKTKMSDYGDCVRYDFTEACWCVFINWSEE